MGNNPFSAIISGGTKEQDTSVNTNPFSSIIGGGKDTSVPTIHAPVQTTEPSSIFPSKGKTASMFSKNQKNTVPDILGTKREEIIQGGNEIAKSLITPMVREGVSVVKGTKNVFSDIISRAKTAVEEKNVPDFARILSPVPSLGEAKKRFLAFTGAETTPTTDLQKRITGSETPFSLQTEGKNVAEAFGFDVKNPLLAGGIGVLGSVLDFSGFGGEKKAITALTKAKTAEEAAGYLKNMGIAESALPKLADDLLAIPTEVERQKWVDNLVTTFKNPVETKPITSLPEEKVLIDEARKFPTPEDYIQQIKGGKTQYGAYSPEIRSTIPAGYTNITELGVDPDEMVTVYRGIDDISGKVKRKINDGDFVTTDFDSALSYTDNPKDVVEMRVKAKDLYNSEPKDFVDEPFYTGAEYIYTTKKAKTLPTDAELTSIWNKANEVTPPTHAERRAEIKSLITQGKNDEAIAKADLLAKDVNEGRVAYTAPVRKEARPKKSLFTKVEKATPEPSFREQALKRERLMRPDIKVDPIKEAKRKARAFDTPESFETAFKQGLVKVSPEAELAIKKQGIPTFYKEAKFGTKKELTFPPQIEETKSKLAAIKDRLDMDREKFDRLRSFITQKGEFKGTLPEITGKSGKYKGRPEIFARKGDDIISELGFRANATQHAEELAREFLETYKRQTSDYLDDLKKFRTERNKWIIENHSKEIADQLIRKGDRDVKKQINKYAAKTKAEAVDQVKKGEYLMDQAFKARRASFRNLKNRFNLTDSELAGVRRGKDITSMSEAEFKAFMKDAEVTAQAIEERRNQFIQTQALINTRELKKTENLQKALKLPQIEKMTTEQLKQFEAALEPYQLGDEFLGVRQLETVKNTDIEGIRTTREAREALVRDVNKMREAEGKTPIKLMDVSNINVGELDRFRYDTALARQNPFYELMVKEKNKAVLNAEYGFLNMKEQLSDLMNAARKSRKRKLLDKLVPTDRTIFTWLEAPASEKLSLAKNMTNQELKAAEYIQKIYSDARDYLVQHEVLKHYKKDYITHVRRGFLEGLKDDGALPAIKEIFEKYKQDEAVFNILNQKTGEVLPLEKFFQFSMKRTGNLKPTQNVSSAVEAYFKTFEKKKALDALIPKIDIYTHSISPKTITPRGLEFDDSLKRFVKEWLNTKKGRVVDTSFVKPGGKIDWVLRTGQALTRILDLGLSVPVGLASNLGEQASTFVNLGTKSYAKGIKRLNSKQGEAITKEYKNFVGEKFLEKMTDSSKTLGDKVGEALFGLFSSSARRANAIHLLGSMSDAEYKAGKISAERLAQIQTDMGRYRTVEGFESILGKTSPGSVMKQYKSWAVPILSQTIDNIGKVTKMLREGEFKEVVKSREFQELNRTILLSSAIGVAVHGFLKDEEGKTAKDRTFLENVMYKSATDSLSLISALDPSVWTASPRLMGFFNDLATSLKQIVMLDRSKKTGELTGVTKLKKMATPAIARQFISEPVTEYKKATDVFQERVDKENETFRPIFDEIWKVKKENVEEADKMVAELSPTQYAVYKRLRASANAKELTQAKKDIYKTYQKVIELKDQGKTEEADAITGEMTELEYKAYQSLKKQFGRD